MYIAVPASGKYGHTVSEKIRVPARGCKALPTVTSRLCKDDTNVNRFETRVHCQCKNEGLEFFVPCCFYFPKLPANSRT